MSICLNMIVKDEAHVIARCLESVKPFIDYWVIVDTGSTDNTRDIILDTMRGIPGVLIDRPWRDFGHNRTEALQLAQKELDYDPAYYLFFIDADDTLTINDWDGLPSDQVGVYSIHMRSGTTRYSRMSFARADGDWSYRGALHEYLVEGDGGLIPYTLLEGLEIVRGFDGARSQQGDVAKYTADALLLEAALEDNPDPRDVFYCAQSWRDAGNYKSALNLYQYRVELSGWPEEVFYSMLQVGTMLEQLGSSFPLIRDAYLDAYSYRPSRAEPLVELARLHRLRDEWSLAYLFASHAAALAAPADVLFVDEEAYEWRALDELSIAAYWVGKYREAELAAMLCLTRQLPSEQVERVKQNLRFAQDMPIPATMRAE